jgi:hypothetical protein
MASRRPVGLWPAGGLVVCGRPVSGPLLGGRLVCGQQTSGLVADG